MNQFWVSKIGIDQCVKQYAVDGDEVTIYGFYLRHFLEATLFKK